MLTLFSRNLIQTSTQLQDEQNRILEEARLKSERRKEEVKATFKSTFARKTTGESATNISNLGDPQEGDMTSDTNINSPQTDSRAKQNNQKNGEASGSTIIDTSMPLVEALRKHLEQN